MDLLFHYKGSIYEAKVLVSDSEAVHYYRCYLTDNELTKEAGDCVTFKTDENSQRLELVYHVGKHAYILINNLQTALQDFIDNNRTSAFSR
jgi:hypothetical protein